jgi:hypothetical protein
MLAGFYCRNNRLEQKSAILFGDIAAAPVACGQVYIIYVLAETAE